MEIKFKWYLSDRKFAMFLALCQVVEVAILIKLLWR